MFETVPFNAQNFDYYNYVVTENFVFEVQKPVISGFYEYEENGVYYCASATEKGIYLYSYCRNNPLSYTDPSGDKITGFDVWNAIMLPIFAPIRALNEGMQWVSDKMNNMQQPGGYFNRSYLMGFTEPGSQITGGCPANIVPYGHPLYISQTPLPSCVGLLRNSKDQLYDIERDMLDKPYVRKFTKRMLSIACKALGSEIDPGQPLSDVYKNPGMIYALKNKWFKYAPNPSGGIRIRTLDADERGKVQPFDDGVNFTGGSIMLLDRERAFASIERLFYTLAHELVHVQQFINLRGQSIADIYDDNFRKALDFYAYSYQNFLGDIYFPVNNVDWSKISSENIARINYQNYKWRYLYDKP